MCEGKYIDDILNRMEITSKIDEMGEGFREKIFMSVNDRIGLFVRKTRILYFIAVAASVFLLIGVTAFFSYQMGYKQQNMQVIQAINPMGMKSYIVLSDGTKVIMNAGTTLFYPIAFVSGNREVEVEGEAYFEVSHDNSHPFIVKTDNVNIRVVGTKFNVKAYKDESQIEVTLVDGIVDVGFIGIEETIRMRPGEQVLYDKSMHTLDHHVVDFNDYIAWKDDKFYFVSCPLEMIARRLERKFNVQITIESEELKSIVYTGDFVRGETLEQILRVMAADKRIAYERDGDVIRLYKK